ncbi:hypothetical protein MA16_Dca010841 [Dendrobium catenatum]|uniref:Uncharacterized protein n=1 Tax=Dendrobium catenatum TaxID=906689 RepID=A0A2I0XFC0_9ASPA|nr:hypothetical protein MA16_Dca010841 [Dendrobium catenatum]
MVIPDRAQRIAGGNPLTDLHRSVPLRPVDQRSIKNRNDSLDQEPIRISSNMVIREGFRPPVRLEPTIEGKGKGVLIDRNIEEMTIPVSPSKLDTEQVASSDVILKLINTA